MLKYDTKSNSECKEITAHQSSFIYFKRYERAISLNSIVACRKTDTIRSKIKCDKCDHCFVINNSIALISRSTNYWHRAYEGY